MVATDAFNQDWAQIRGFTNLQWCLIARCLSQIETGGKSGDND